MELFWAKIDKIHSNPLQVLKIPAGALPNRANVYLDEIFVETVRADKIHLDNVLHLGSRAGTLEIVLDIFGFTSGPDEMLRDFRKGISVEKLRLDIEKEAVKLFFNPLVPAAPN